MLGCVAHLRIHPAQGLREPRFVADVYGFFRFSNRRLAALPPGSVLMDDSGDLTVSRFWSTALFSCRHADGDGHSISGGRRRRKLAIADHLTKERWQECRRSDGGQERSSIHGVPTFLKSSVAVASWRPGLSGLEAPGLLHVRRSTNSIWPFRLRRSSFAQRWSASSTSRSMRSRKGFRSATNH